MGYTKKHPKCQIPRWPGSAASRLENYTKEIMKNTTTTKIENRISKFLTLKTFV